MLGSLGITRQFVDYLPLSSRSDPTTQCPQVGPRAELKQKSKRVSCSQFVTPFAYSHKGRTLVAQLNVHATAAETNQPKWWEKNGPNMVDIHSAQEFVDALSQAEDRLVIVDFYGTWCASCRALFPKLCRLAQDHPEILFLKVDFDQNKSLCKSLNIKVLPYFHFYRGADRLVDSFSCSLAKIQKLKDAIAAYNVKNCSSQISPNDSNDGSVSQNS